MAGFDVLSCISGPAGSCLAYSLLNDQEQDETVLTLHCGGSNVVATIAQINCGLLSIKETVTSTNAGDSLTCTLVNHFAKEFFS